VKFGRGSRSKSLGFSQEHLTQELDDGGIKTGDHLQDIAAKTGSSSISSQSKLEESVSNPAPATIEKSYDVGRSSGEVYDTPHGGCRNEFDRRNGHA